MKKNRRRLLAVSEALESRRLLAGVTLDRFSGTNGVTFARPEDQWSFQSGLLAPLADGRVYVGDTGQHGLIGRFKRDGTVDTSFGNSGFIDVNTNLSDSTISYYFGVRKIIAHADGSFIVLTNTARRPTSNTADADITVSQYRTDGSLDTTFGTNGSTLINVTSNDRAGDAIQLANGRIIVVGASTYYGQGFQANEGIIARLNADGSFDTTSPNGGIEVLNQYSVSNRTDTSFDQVTAVSDNGYLVTGVQVKGVTSTQLLVRFDANDLRHTAFGTGGELRDNRYASLGNYAYDASRNAIVSAGQSLVRFDADTAALDTTLGPNGSRVLSSSSSQIVGTRLAIDSEGNLNVSSPNNGIDLFARYTANGDPIGSNLVSTALAVRLGSAISSLVALPNGQVLATGYVSDNTVAPNAPLSLIRLNTFGPSTAPRFFQEIGGYLDVYLTEGSDTISVQQDGTDLVIGWAGGERRTPLAGLSRIVIADGGGNDTLTLANLDTTLPIDIDLGDGDDTLQIAASVNAGAIRVLGGAGNDRLERSTAADITSLSFSAMDGVDTYALLGTDGNDSIVVDDGSVADVTYATTLTNISAIQVLAGAGNDTIDIRRTPAGATLDVDGGDDADVITLAGLDVVARAAATLRGGAGDDQFISHGSQRSATINGGAGDDRLQFIADGNNETVAYNGDGTFKQTDVSPRALTVTPVAIDHVSFDAPVGSSGNNLYFNDAALTNAQAYTVTDSAATREGLGLPVSFSNLAIVTIGPGTGDDTIISTAAPDKLRVSVQASAGSDRFILDRTNDPRSTTYTIDAGTYSVSVNGGAAVSANAIVKFATILAGAGDDLFNASARTNQGVQWTLDGGTGNDTLNVAIAGASSPVKGVDSPDNGRVTFADRATIEFRSMEAANLVSPRVLSAAFDPSLETINFTLEIASQAVSLHPASTFVELVNLTTGRIYTATELAAAVSGTTLKVGLSGGPARIGNTTATPAAVFENGNYRLILHTAGNLKDSASNNFAGDTTIDFFILRGDANQDRIVNFDDLVALARNYGKTPRNIPLLASGDFNHDGYVNFDDLVILAQNYNRTLAPNVVTLVANTAGAKKKRDRIELD